MKNHFKEWCWQLVVLARNLKIAWMNCQRNVAFRWNFDIEKEFHFYSIFLLTSYMFRLFYLHPEKWFEGYPVKSTQIFSGCSPDFFLIYKYDTQFFSGCPSEKNPSWPNPLLVTVLLSTTLSGYRKGVWSNPDIASSGIERGCQGCLVPAEFLDSTVWHPLILAILLHNVVFHP